MKTFLYIIVISILFVCCQEQQDYQRVRVYANSKELNGEEILSQVYGKIFVKKIDSVIVLSTQNDTLIHIYDSDFNLMAKIGMIGRGPNEYTYPPIIYDGYKSKDGIKFFDYDSQLKQFSIINLRQSIDSNRVVKDKIFELPVELSGVRDLFYLPDTALISVYEDRFYKRLDEQRGVLKYNFDTGEVDLIDLQNLELFPYDLTAAINLNAKIPSISPDRKKLVVASAYTPLLEVVNIKSNTSEKYLFGNNNLINSYPLEDYVDDLLTQYFKYVYTTDEYIYLLGPADLMDKETNHDQLLVYDWELNPINRYIIPAKYEVEIFYVNDEVKSIMGLSYTNDALYQFELSEK